MLLWRCAMILDPYSLPTLWRRRVGRCDVSRAMLESKHRRGGPTSLTTALGTGVKIALVAPHFHHMVVARGAMGNWCENSLLAAPHFHGFGVARQEGP